MESVASHKQSVARLSVYSNITLVIFKLTIGLAAGSVSIISEALHSANDFIAAIMAYVSIRKSSEPADKIHQFGHGKYESISGAVESALIIIAGLVIIQMSVRKFLTGAVIDAEKLDWGILVMVISAVVNHFVSRKLLKTAKETDSIALEADGWHLKADVYTSVGVLAGLVIIRISGWHFLDPLFGIIVALYIIYIGFDLLRKTWGNLADAAIPPTEQKKIEEVVLEHHDQFEEFHDMRTRMAGAERHVDLHLVVPGEVTVKEAHEFCDHLEKDIEEVLPGTNVMIHLEPQSNTETQNEEKQ